MDFHFSPILFPGWRLESWPVTGTLRYVRWNVSSTLSLFLRPTLATTGNQIRWFYAQLTYARWCRDRARSTENSDSLRSGSSGRRNVRNGRSFMTNPARVRTEQRRRRPEAGRDASSPVLVALDGEGKRVQPRSYFGRALPISRPKWLRA
ncbi:uncharacterized protein LOC143143605 isoform X1 [Ptiloglossa arizonensis]|uniref:uncharacterized protein LOC143143605 isoform X1 n=1 Tax=Ptiloglossa arizonensis TaxID=3350558 RepID=UPI003FA0E3E7